MNTIGNSSPLPVLPAAPKASAPVIAAPREAILSKQPTEIVDVKLSTPQQAAPVLNSEPIANSQVLGTSTFTMFRDSSGLLITRVREGNKFSYFPRDPELSRVDIKA